MHSVFWTLAKSNYRQPTVHGTGSIWIEHPETDISPSLNEDITDYSYNAFMQESTLDEIAVAGGTDQLDLRRRLMAPHPIAIRLIDAVEDLSNWAIRLPAGQARGFAFAFSSGTWIANVVEVSQAESGVRIDKVFCVADPGFVRDERTFRAQMTSGMISALAAAIGVDGASARQQPQIEVELQSSTRHMSGTGERVVPPIMPALANAVFALTGKRVRSMPLGDEVTFI
jgi:isoquinoline 1-oxidoreductase beta subunit